MTNVILFAVFFWSLPLESNLTFQYLGALYENQTYFIFKSSFIWETSSLHNDSPKSEDIKYVIDKKGGQWIFNIWMEIKFLKYFLLFGCK